MLHVINIKGINKKYGNKAVLNNLDFSIRANSFTALIGNNGCGKSTIVNILCNIVNFDSGEIEVFNKRLTTQYVSYKNRVGFVLSQPVYVPEFTTNQYLKFVCKFQNVSDSEISNRVSQIVGFFDIQDPDTPIKYLSLGNKMKVSLAGALVHNPEFLILDEPFANLDITTTASLIHLLNSFKGSKTLLITSHNLDLVVDLCDTFLIMGEGQIKLEIKKEENQTIDSLKMKIKEMLEKRSAQSIPSWLSDDRNGGT